MNTVTSQVTFHSVILSDEKCFSAYQGELWVSDILCAILIVEELDENIHKNKIIKIAEHYKQYIRKMHYTQPYSMNFRDHVSQTAGLFFKLLLLCECIDRC